jgi:hypothetical protein
LADLRQRQISEAIAMKAVMEAEINLGNHPQDASQSKLGYEIESLDPQTGRLRFIEVKGRRAGAETVSRNEILTGINAAEQFILAIVEIAEGQAKTPGYIHQPFTREPDFEVTSVNYDLPELLARSSPPA